MLATKYVRASAQSYAYRAIEDMLTDDEKYIFRRGRNAHPATVPKNADVGDYRTATGFEALLGYLYLSGENERLCEIAQRAIKRIEESMKDGEKNGLRKQ